MHEESNQQKQVQAISPLSYFYSFKVITHCPDPKIFPERRRLGVHLFHGIMPVNKISSIIKATPTSRILRVFFWEAGFFLQERNDRKLSSLRLCFASTWTNPRCLRGVGHICQDVAAPVNGERWKVFFPFHISFHDLYVYMPLEKTKHINP